MAVPVVPGKKSPKEKFAGGDCSTTVERLMFLELLGHHHMHHQSPDVGPWGQQGTGLPPSLWRSHGNLQVEHSCMCCSNELYLYTSESSVKFVAEIPGPNWEDDQLTIIWSDSKSPPKLKKLTEYFNLLAEVLFPLGKNHTPHKSVLNICPCSNGLSYCWCTCGALTLQLALWWWW